MQKRGQGQPTLYTQKLADRICLLISTHPLGLPSLIRMYPELPDRQTIYNWMHAHPSFFDNYLRAKEQQAHLLVDEVLEVSSEVPTYLDKDGIYRIDNGVLGKAKLQVDSFKWCAAVLAPRFYNKEKNQETNTALKDDVIRRKKELDDRNKKDY